MTIDTRQWAYCNLGPLADESPCSISEDYIQGSGGGVIMVKGTINLKGTFRPLPGDEVYIATSDGQNWNARLPLKLRVMNSFADPLRNVTTVLVGCKFAYMKDRKPPVTNITEREANTDVPEIDRRAFTQSIKASTVAQKILDALGLTAAGPIPFTNSRILDEWDLSAGFVQELATIAEAECYRCRLNEDEQVEFINLNQEGGPCVLITEKELIDFTPQTVGELPADSVYAKYESTQLKPPNNDPNDPNDDDKRSKSNWELETSFSQEQYIHTYTNADGETVKQKGVYNKVSVSQSVYDGKDRLQTRKETSTDLLGITTSITIMNYPTVLPVNLPSEITYMSSDSNQDYSEVISEITTEYSPFGNIAGSCGLDAPLETFRGLGNYQSSYRETRYDKDKGSGITKTTTTNLVPFINTPFGSEAISTQSGNIDTENIEEILELMREASALVSYGNEVRIRTEREFGLQKRPSQQERNKMVDQKAPSVEQKGEIIWAVGSATSQTALELSPPYVSDDRIIKKTTNGVTTYEVEKSDAAQKAQNYATIENRLLLAHRSGAGIQIRVIDTPPRPFDLFYVRLNGCTAAYRVNGRSWTISPDGVIVNIDGLFWGAVDGQINQAWFPLPPSISSLPETAAVTTNANTRPPNAIPIPNGFNPLNPDLNALFNALPTNQPPIHGATINPTHIIKPYHETVSLVGGIRIGCAFEIQTWLPTEVILGGGIKIGAGLEISTPITVGANIQEIAQLIAGPYIIDGLPIPAGDLYDFTSDNYDSSGYLFDDDQFKLTVTDFSGFPNTTLYTAAYNPLYKQFKFTTTQVPSPGTFTGPFYKLEYIGNETAYKRIKKIACVINDYDTSDTVSHEIFFTGDLDGSASFSYENLNITTADFENPDEGSGITYLEIVPTITSDGATSIKYVHTIDFW